MHGLCFIAAVHQYANIKLLLHNKRHGFEIPRKFFFFFNRAVSLAEDCPLSGGTESAYYYTKPYSRSCVGDHESQQ